MTEPTLATIHPMPSAALISDLEELLAAAKRGEIIGIAYAVLKPAQEFEVGTSGLYRVHPQAALGPVNRLINTLTMK